ETILISGFPFQIVGIFEHYENEDSKTARKQGKKPKALNRFGKLYDPYALKNGTVIAPFNTIYYDFKAATVVNKEDQGPTTKIDGLFIQVTDPAKVQDALEEVSNLLQQTHRGVEDFG